MAITKLDANDIGLYISTNTATPAWKLVVCVEDHTLEGSKDVTTRRTRCGPLRFASDAEFSVTSSGAANITPTVADEVSIEELMTIFQAGNTIAWKLEHMNTAANYHRSGTGVMTAFTETGNEGDAVSFDLTIEVDGTVDQTA